MLLPLIMDELSIFNTFNFNSKFCYKEIFFVSLFFNYKKYSKKKSITTYCNFGLKKKLMRYYAN